MAGLPACYLICHSAEAGDTIHKALERPAATHQNSLRTNGRRYALAFVRSLYISLRPTSEGSIYPEICTMCLAHNEGGCAVIQSVRDETRGSSVKGDDGRGTPSEIVRRDFIPSSSCGVLWKLLLYVMRIVRRTHLNTGVFRRHGGLDEGCVSQDEHSRGSNEPEEEGEGRGEPEKGDTDEK